MSIYKKLNEFKKAVGTIKKDGNNPHYKSKYATIESVLDTIEQPLSDNNLGFIQCVEDMFLITTIYDTESDAVITSKTPLLLNKQDMQQLGSAITYARRYALVTMFGLEQEDDDGNKASGLPQQPQANNQPQQQAKVYATKEQATELATLAKATNQDINEVTKFFKVDGLMKLTDKQFFLAKRKLEAKEFIQ